MRSKGYRFTLGVWGLRLCSLDGAQTSATVRMPMASSAKVVTFGGFKRRVASFRVASVALCDIPTFFIMCPKSFCAEGAILVHTFAVFSEN